jgi:hypothetical protein
MRIAAYCDKNGNTKTLPPQLPLVHTTRGVPSRAIFETFQLKGKFDESFKQDMLYFFYGLPSYKPERKDELTSIDGALWPVCFIVRPISDGPLQAIYPFDTGAYLAEYYTKVISPDVSLNNFLLGATMDIPPKVVSTFFGTNMNYYAGNYNSFLHFDYEDIEANYYYRLIQIKENTPLDSRRRTIEVHTSGTLLIGVDLAVEAVVLPLDAMQSPLINKVVTERWEADVLTYYTFLANTPEECIPLIKEKVYNYYASRGLL